MSDPDPPTPTADTIFEAANRTRDAADMLDRRAFGPMEKAVAAILRRIENTLRELAVIVEVKEGSYEAE